MSVTTLVKSIQDIMRKDVGVDGDAQRISQLCWMFFLKIIDDQDKELELLKDGYRPPIPVHLRWRSWAADPEGITGEELLDFVNGDLFPAAEGTLAQGRSSRECRARCVRGCLQLHEVRPAGAAGRKQDQRNRLQQLGCAPALRRHLRADPERPAIGRQRGRILHAACVDLVHGPDDRPKTGRDAARSGMRYRRIPHLCHPSYAQALCEATEDEAQMQASLRAVEKKPLPHMLAITNMLLHGIEDPSFLRHDNTLARPYISWRRDERVDIVLTNPPFGGKEEDGIESNFPKHFQTRETADLFLALIIRILKPGGRAAVILPDGSLFGEGVKTRLKEHLIRECNLHTIVRLPNSVFRPYASIGTNLLFFEKGEPTKDIWFWEHLVPVSQKAYS